MNVETAPPAAITYPFDAKPAPGKTQEVAPGVSWIRMPLPFALDHINLWMLEDGDGWTLVDTGFGIDATKQYWEEILAEHCHTRPVKRIIVTHYHPDHLGLADWLAQKLQVKVWMTHAEFLLAHAVKHGVAGCDWPAMLDLFRRHGLDDASYETLFTRGNSYARGVPSLPQAHRRIFDGETIEIGGHGWRVIAGYGHSPEHAALYCADCNDGGMLISGDMVLPRISTNVSVHAINPDGDPLGLFLASLTHYAQLPPETLILPSHGLPFHGLRPRVAALHAHHEERCGVLLAACNTPKTAYELLPVLFTRALDMHQIMFAMGEAIAHLNYLEHGGKLRRLDNGDGVIHFVKEA